MRRRFQDKLIHLIIPLGILPFWFVLTNYKSFEAERVDTVEVLCKNQKVPRAYDVTFHNVVLSLNRIGR